VMAIASALFFVERAVVTVQKRRWSYVSCLFLIGLVFVGFFTWGGGPLTTFSPISLEDRKFTYVLDKSSIINVLKADQTVTILGPTVTIIDSPILPYYFIYGYLSPRISVEHNIVALNVSTDHYNYKLLNGICYPRFVLARLNTSEQQLLELILASPMDALTFFGNMNLIFNDGYISVERAYGSP